MQGISDEEMNNCKKLSQLNKIPTMFKNIFRQNNFIIKLKPHFTAYLF